MTISYGRPEDPAETERFEAMKRATEERQAVSGQETPEGSMGEALAASHPLPYAGPAVIVYPGGFHGVDLELATEGDGPLFDWGAVAKVTDPLVGRWRRLVGQYVSIILPGLYVSEAVVVEFVYDGAGTARARLRGNGHPPRRAA